MLLTLQALGPHVQNNIAPRRRGQLARSYLARGTACTCSWSVFAHQQQLRQCTAARATRRLALRLMGSRDGASRFESEAM